MNPLAIGATAQPTMTSREIAELADNPATLPAFPGRLAGKGAISQPPTVDGQKSPNGVVGKRDSCFIVAAALVADRAQAA